MMPQHSMEYGMSAQTRFGLKKATFNNYAIYYHMNFEIFPGW